MSEARHRIECYIETIILVGTFIQPCFNGVFLSGNFPLSFTDSVLMTREDEKESCFIPPLLGKNPDYTKT